MLHKSGGGGGGVNGCFTLVNAHALIFKLINLINDFNHQRGGWDRENSFMFFSCRDSSCQTYNVTLDTASHQKMNEEPNKCTKGNLYEFCLVLCQIERHNIKLGRRRGGGRVFLVVSLYGQCLSIRKSIISLLC